MVCRAVEVLAVRRYWDGSVVGACVALLRMLGEDSTRLRVHALVANTLARHSTQQPRHIGERRPKTSSYDFKIDIHLQCLDSMALDRPLFVDVID